jgi:hypothetical protein
MLMTSDSGGHARDSPPASNPERCRKLVVEVEVDNLEEQIRQIRETTLTSNSPD